MTHSLRKWTVLGVLLLPLLGAGWRGRTAAAEPKAESPPAVDRLGFPLPHGATARLGSLAFHHESPVISLAYSPDGKILASGSEDGSVHFWDPATGREVRLLHGHLNSVVTLVFSPDGKYLATGEFTDRQPGQSASLAPRRAVLVAAAGDGPVAAAELAGEPPPPEDEFWAKQNGQVRLWEVASGKLLHTFPGDARPLAAFSPDSAVFATRGPGGTLQTWDIAGDQQKLNLTRLPHFPQGISFLNNGKVLATVGSIREELPMDNETPVPAGGLALYDTANGRQKRLFIQPAFPSSNSVIAFSPDARAFVLVSEDRSVQLWESATGKLRRQFKRKGAGDGLAALNISPDGRYLVLEGTDRRVRIWNMVRDELELTVRTGSPTRRPGVSYLDALLNQPDPNMPVDGMTPSAAVAISPDGKTLVVGGENRTLRFWDLTTGQERLPTVGHRFDVTAVAVAPDGKLVATGGSDRTIRLWDPARQTEVGQIRGSFGPVTFLAFAPGGKQLLSGGPGDQVVRLWDVAAGKELHQFRAGSPAEALRQLQKGNNQPAFEPSLMLLVNEGKQLAAFTPDGQTVITRDVHFVEKGNLLTGALIFWDVNTGKERRSVKVFHLPLNPNAPSVPTGPETVQPPKDVPKEEVAETPSTAAAPGMVNLIFALSTDGKLLVTNGAGSLTVWDAAAGKILRSIETNADAPPSLLALSSDGKTLAVVAARTVGQRRPQPYGGAAVPPPATVPPGMVPGNEDQDSAAVITLYDTASGEELRELEGHDAAVSAVAFTEDGKRLISVGHDKTLRLWDAGTGKQLRHISGHRGPILALALSADGTTLATGGGDATALVWKSAEVFRDGTGEAGALKNADALWADLASADAARAARAMRDLSVAPGAAVMLLAQRAQPQKMDAATTRRIDALITDLDSDKFPVREKAAAQLEKFGELAEGALQKVLAGKPALETKQRVEQILKNIDEGMQSGDHIRALRTVELLEQIGTPEARQVLEGLAKGAPEMQLTLDAKAALTRLGRRGP